MLPHGKDILVACRSINVHGALVVTHLFARLFAHHGIVPLLAIGHLAHPAHRHAHAFGIFPFITRHYCSEILVGH